MLYFLIPSNLFSPLIIHVVWLGANLFSQGSRWNLRLYDLQASSRDLWRRGSDFIIWAELIFISLQNPRQTNMAAFPNQGNVAAQPSSDLKYSFVNGCQLVGGPNSLKENPTAFWSGLNMKPSEDCGEAFLLRVKRSSNHAERRGTSTQHRVCPLICFRIWHVHILFV